MRQNMEELQATQEESTRREAEMQDTIDAINNTLGNYDLDMNGYIISSNDKYADLIGKKPEEIIGKEHVKLISESKNDLEHYEEIWNGLRNGIPSEIELKYNAGEKEVWLKESFTPVKNADGDYEKVVTLVFDISEKRSKDSAIRAYQHEIEDVNELLKDTMEQLTNFKDEYEAKISELNKEKEIIEEESRVQIESLKMQIQELGGEEG
jgi:methyl-accepting chemotaxis protein